jgi:hypothetical protein
MKATLRALVLGAAVVALAAGAVPAAAPEARHSQQDAEPALAGAEGVPVRAAALASAGHGGDAAARRLAATGASNATSWTTFTAHAVPKIARRLGIVADDGGDACGLAVQQQFNCTDVACEDLVPG